MTSRAGLRALVLVGLLFASILPLTPGSSAEIVCCDTSEFDLFLVGENDGATLTPFKSELVGINSKGVSQSVQGTEEISSWEIVWKQSGTIPESTWEFSIAYEVENAAGVHANATVEVKVGNNAYTAESGNPGVFFTGEGLVTIDLDIPQIAINSNDIIEVTFSVRSMLFSQPGDDSSIQFIWGEDTDSSIRVDLPLLTIDMPNALVVEGEVYFPVILRSGFGERMWSSLEDFEFKNGGSIITDVRSPSIVSGGIEVPFVWNPGADPTDGNYQVELSIWLNEGEAPLTTGRTHTITFEEGVSQNYHFGEPARAMNSRLDVDINVNYDGSKAVRTVELEIEGSMASWLRWGMDNIGNSSLPSDHLFAQVQSGAISPSLRENGRVDDVESGSLLNYIDSSTRNLEIFLGNTGLALNPDGLFEDSLFDLNPEIEIDLMGVVGIDDAPMRIRIDVVYDLTGKDRDVLLVEDFIRPQLGNGIWTMNGEPAVDLSVKLKTSALAGIFAVLTEDMSEDIKITHYRLGYAEVVSLEVEGLSDDVSFVIEYQVTGNALYSPLVTLLATIILLFAGVVIGTRMTKNRSRIIVTLSSLLFVGILGYVYTLSALPPTFVMGIAAASTMAMVPLALISPRNTDWTMSEGDMAEDYEQSISKVIPTVDCPACKTANPVMSSERPLRIPCGGCGRKLRIED
ncbi:MAG: hypothetical protein CMB37_04190 [Euryarchaeota archaeon]|nr:hypothetical protein [Euryarchaeota archaeon]MED5487271.1 hypothetical protein [Candidatus Thermoplasmatota archaeon]